MAQVPVSPVVLIILDGWGYREEADGNAVATAHTPVMDSLWKVYPHTLIRTSGKDVGLPDGQMGNSEVGHLNIGAGRVVPQELVRISDAVETGALLRNAALVQVCQAVQAGQGKLHLVGLCSEGGVHSHLDHLVGLLNLAKAQGIEQVCIHAIMDGRDTLPMEGIHAIQRLQSEIDLLEVGKITTIAGRYYSMDRDRRWDRVKLAYEVMTQDGAGTGQTPLEAVQAAYEAGQTDEFILPVRLAPGAVEAEDGVIFFNFRPDRARQLTQAFVDPAFDGFERTLIQSLSFATLTQYDPSLPVVVAFEPMSLTNILGEVVAKHGLKQFRTAETEKYAHVTYFFNGGLEEPFPGEERALVPSPMVMTYDQAPAMSAAAVTEGAINAVNQGIYSLIVINYANPDMVGHTGKMDPTVKALEVVDQCLGKLLATVNRAGGTALITADHGNAEQMWDDAGNPWTAHTSNLVPFILVEGEGLKIPGHGTDVSLREDGRLSDIAPTILDILKLPQPNEMTGRSMIQTSDFEIRANRTPVKIGR
ncbi:MAG: 2,3-bisphosphoglycerate-independent phosphoglycerate mutase [Synechococcales bacterium]|nr:2,3-bisphosphoglycerate-independent phosphoglycerate mutase [Synechococcales bacterium]